jgi:hypothetical protein
VIAVKALTDRELLRGLLVLGATYDADVSCDRFKAVGVVYYQGAHFPFHESRDRIITLADSDSRNLARSLLEKAGAR